MLRNNSKSLGNHLVSPEEKERLQWEGFAEKCFESGMKERVGDEKLSMTVSGINDQKLCLTKVVCCTAPAARPQLSIDIFCQQGAQHVQESYYVIIL